MQNVRRRRQADQYEYTPTKTRCPLLLVADYRFFQEMGSGNTKTTINYLVNILLTHSPFPSFQISFVNFFFLFPIRSVWLIVCTKFTMTQSGKIDRIRRDFVAWVLSLRKLLSIRNRRGCAVVKLITIWFAKNGTWEIYWKWVELPFATSKSCLLIGIVFFFFAGVFPWIQSQGLLSGPFVHRFEIRRWHFGPCVCWIAATKFRRRNLYTGILQKWVHIVSELGTEQFAKSLRTAGYNARGRFGYSTWIRS